MGLLPPMSRDFIAPSSSCLLQPNATPTDRFLGPKNTMSMQSTYVECEPIFFLPSPEPVGSKDFGDETCVIRAMYRQLFFEAILQENTFSSTIIAMNQIFKVLLKEPIDDCVETLFDFQVEYDGQNITGFWIHLQLHYQKSPKHKAVHEKHEIHFQRFLTQHESENEKQRKKRDEEIVEIINMNRQLREKNQQLEQLVLSQKAAIDELEGEKSKDQNALSKCKASLRDSLSRNHALSQKIAEWQQLAQQIQNHS
jgi:hypothetical protein